MDKLWKKGIFLLVLVFLLNLIWEVLHSGLYVSKMLEENYWKTIILASLGDVLYVGLIFLVVGLWNRRIKWIDNPKRGDYILVAVSGIIIAVFVELKGFALGKWSYTSAMPTIFGIGISPLLQLAVTVSLALLVVSKINF